LWYGLDNVAKFPLLLAQPLFHSLSVLNIDIGSVPFEDIPMLVAERFATEQEPAIFSVEAAQARFDFTRLAGIRTIFDLRIRWSRPGRRAGPRYGSCR
jgi:hypothetical protein